MMMSWQNQIGMRVMSTMLVGALLLVACASGSTLSVEGDEALELTLSATAEHAKIEAGERRYKIGLEQINDSRCPANAKCLWAGELAAVLSLDRTDTQTPRRSFTLGEESVPSIEVEGLAFELVSITETSVTFTVRAAATP